MTRTEILEHANEIVNGAREQAYGAPEDSFELISNLWGDYLNTVFKRRGNFFLDRTDVAALMILLKVARIAGGTGKDDNWIDIAGYAACGGELEAT